MKNDKVVNVFYGCQSWLSNCVGYCKYHKKYLTENQIKTRKCISKNCVHLQKIEHKFWRRRERIKEIRRNK